MRRRADRVRPKAGRARHLGLGAVPQGGYLRCRLLQLAEEVRRARSLGAAPAQAAQTGEREAHAPGCRVVARQGDTPGCALKRRSEALPEAHAGGQSHGLDFHQGGVLKRARLRGAMCASGSRSGRAVPTTRRSGATTTATSIACMPMETVFPSVGLQGSQCAGAKGCSAESSGTTAERGNSHIEHQQVASGAV